MSLILLFDMKLSHNTLLITGGATGIGLELARAFVAQQNTVIICGRRPDKLAEAQRQVPGLITYACDVADPEQRRGLFAFCTQKYPGINILINNAGMQREINFLNGEADLIAGDDEVAINLDACIHLAALFIPYFLSKPEAALVNVTSGLGIVPLQITPVYSATKAGLHSLTVSIRRQLQGTSVKVFELIPPVVDTDLDRGARDRRGQTDKGIKPEQVATEALQGMARDQFEIAVGMVKILRVGARIAPGFFLNVLNKRVAPGSK